MIYKANIKIMPLAELLDPQGKAVNESLDRLGLEGLENVRIGKHITLNVEADNETSAREKVEHACKKLLTNPIMESFEIALTASL